MLIWKCNELKIFKKSCYFCLFHWILRLGGEVSRCQIYLWFINVLGLYSGYASFIWKYLWVQLQGLLLSWWVCVRKVLPLHDCAVPSLLLSVVTQNRGAYTRVKREEIPTWQMITNDEWDKASGGSIPSSGTRRHEKSASPCPPRWKHFSLNLEKAVFKYFHQQIQYGDWDIYWLG